MSSLCSQFQPGVLCRVHAERVTNTGLGPALAHMIVASLNDRIGNGQDDFQPQDEAAWLDAISAVHRR